jgi:hypothetical protein
MSFSAGDTIFNRSAEGVPSHLWVIVSDPGVDADRVLIANLTHWDDRYADPACRLAGGDHPFITKDTYVNYEDARIVALADLETGEKRGIFERRQALSPALLQRIRDGAIQSEFCPNKCKRLLSEQESA